MDGWSAPPLVSGAAGGGLIDTYTIDYAGAAPHAVVVGRLTDGRRFVAMSDEPAIVQAMIAGEPLGGKVTVEAGENGRSIVTGFAPVV